MPAALALQRQSSALDLEVLVHVLKMALAEPFPLAQLPEQLDQRLPSALGRGLERQLDHLLQQIDLRGLSRRTEPSKGLATGSEGGVRRA